MSNVIDQLNSADPLATSMVAFQLASHMQDWPLSRQVLATGMLFLILSETSGVDVVDTLAKLKSIINDTDPYHHRQVAALKQLIREEYLK
jgi:hypothetical protein